MATEVMLGLLLFAPPAGALAAAVLARTEAAAGRAGRLAAVLWPWPAFASVARALPVWGPYHELFDRARGNEALPRWHAHAEPSLATWLALAPLALALGFASRRAVEGWVRRSVPRHVAAGALALAALAGLGVVAAPPAGPSAARSAGELVGTLRSPGDRVGSAGRSLTLTDVGGVCLLEHRWRTSVGLPPAPLPAGPSPWPAPWRDGGHWTFPCASGEISPPLDVYEGDAAIGVWRGGALVGAWQVASPSAGGRFCALGPGASAEARLALAAFVVALAAFAATLARRCERLGRGLDALGEGRLGAGGLVTTGGGLFRVEALRARAPGPVLIGGLTMLEGPGYRGAGRARVARVVFGTRDEVRGGLFERARTLAFGSLVAASTLAAYALGLWLNP